MESKDREDKKPHFFKVRVSEESYVFDFEDKKDALHALTNLLFDIREYNLKK